MWCSECNAWVCSCVALHACHARFCARQRVIQGPIDRLPLAHLPQEHHRPRRRRLLRPVQAQPRLQHLCVLQPATSWLRQRVRQQVRELTASSGGARCYKAAVSTEWPAAANCRCLPSLVLQVRPVLQKSGVHIEGAWEGEGIGRGDRQKGERKTERGGQGGDGRRHQLKSYAPDHTAGTSAGA